MLNRLPKSLLVPCRGCSRIRVPRARRWPLFESSQHPYQAQVLAWSLCASLAQQVSQGYVTRLMLIAQGTVTCDGMSVNVHGISTRVCIPVQVCLLEPIPSVQLRPANPSPHKPTARHQQSQLSVPHTDHMCDSSYPAFSWEAATGDDLCLFNS